MATNALTLSWAWEALSAEERLSPGQRTAIGASLLVALLLDPRCYQTARYDVHLEPFMALFALGAARVLWRVRAGASLPWVVAVALCGANGALALVGIGLGALLARRRTRLAGTAVLAAGAARALLCRTSAGSVPVGRSSPPAMATSRLTRTAERACSPSLPAWSAIRRCRFAPSRRRFRSS